MTRDTYTYESAVDLSGREGDIVSFAGPSVTGRSSGLCQIAPNAAVRPLGVIKAVNGDLITVGTIGCQTIRFGAGGIAPETALAASAAGTGRAVAAGAGDFVVGIYRPQAGGATAGIDTRGQAEIRPAYAVL